MKKLLIICLMIFIIVGCNKDVKGNETNNLPEPTDNSLIKTNFGELSFEFDSACNPGGYENSFWIGCGELHDDKYSQSIRLYYYKNADLEDMISEVVGDRSVRTINSIKWDIVENKDVLTSYLTEKNNTVYVILFYSEVEDETFVDNFINTVSFN